MFKSKTRNIVVPQSEHARLAGLMAFHWGNDDFEKTKLPFESFVKGVAFHDRGYPRLDNFPINEMNEADWLEILERGVEADYSDNIADIVILLQIKRVALYNKTSEREKFAQRIQTKIASLIARQNHTEEEFSYADKITGFCDSVSYKFCFEELCSLNLKVKANHSDSSETEINVEFGEAGLIRVSPWPFCQSRLAGYLNAYEKDGYPEKLDPTILSFEIVRG